MLKKVDKRGGDKVRGFLLPRNEQVIRGGSFSIFTEKFIGKCVKTQLVCFIVTLLRNFIGLDDVYASEITTYLKNIQCCFFGQKRCDDDQIYAQ